MQIWQESVSNLLPFPTKGLVQQSASEVLFNIYFRLARELEKKFSDSLIFFVAKRRILAKPLRNNQIGQKRPISRTCKAVHDAILEDITYPTEIIGKRTRNMINGKRLIKVYLDTKDMTTQGHKLDTFHSVYKALTKKQAEFIFPVNSAFDLI